MSAVVVTPNYPMRVAVPQQHRELGCIRIRIGSQRAHVTFPKSGKPFDTCNPAGKLSNPLPLSADTGVLIAASRLIALRFNSFRPLAGWSFPGISRALQACKQSARCLANRLQDFILSAQAMGLVASGDGHTLCEGKPICPNQDGTNPYRNRANAR